MVMLMVLLQVMSDVMVLLQVMVMVMVLLQVMSMVTLSSKGGLPEKLLEEESC
jgi:hypothetical protein